MSCKCRLGTKRILTRWLCATRGSLACPIYSRQGKCILLASLLGAIFGLRSGGAASAWAVSFCPCYFGAVKASCVNSLCVAVVIVRAVRAVVVIIDSCQSVPSIKNVVGQFEKLQPSVG